MEQISPITTLTTFTPSVPCESSDAGATQPLRRENPGIEYWRVERVARYLDVSRKRVYHLIQEKKLSAVRIGPRTLRVLRASIEQYLAARLAAGVDPDADPEFQP